MSLRQNKSVKNAAKLTIGRLAREGGVGVPTVRYYQKRGLLKQPHKPAFGGIRVYGEADLSRLLRIRDAQRLGFTLSEIAALLGHLEQKSCQSIRQLIVDKQEELTQRLDQMAAARKKLAELNAACRGDCIADCPLLDDRLWTELQAGG